MKVLWFARAMLRFVSERDFWKLAPMVPVSVSLGLWIVMRVVGVVTQVGADVSPEVVKTMKVRDRKRTCEQFA